MEAVKLLAVWACAVPLMLFATPTGASLVAGLPLILAGVLARGWAAGHLRRNQELATSGPYAYVRDPLYLGRLFLLCGFAVMANNGVTYILFGLAAAVFFASYMPRKVRKETERLAQRFGPRYADYRGEVRSLLPRLRRYVRRSAARWDFRVFWRENREQWLIGAVALLVALLVLKWHMIQTGSVPVGPPPIGIVLFARRIDSTGAPA